MVTLTIINDPPGLGAVYIDPYGWLCTESSCVYPVPLNDVAALHAWPNQGANFIGWSGEGINCDVLPDCDVYMDADKVVWAHWEYGEEMVPNIRLDGPLQVNFGTVPLGQSSQRQTWLMTNIGNVMADMNVSIIGPDSNQFNCLVGCLPGGIPPGHTEGIMIVFQPTIAPQTGRVAVKNAILRINCLNCPQVIDVKLTGTVGQYRR